MAFTEFYMTSGGSNLNAGSTSGGAVYSSAGGDWVNTTRVFTPNDGVNPSLTVAVGDFASVYVTAGATVSAFIGRVTTVVNAVNGAITLDGTVKYGTSPANSSGAHTMTLKTGGAWVGPGAAVTFPFALSGTIGALVNTSNDQTRVNVKNDQTYTMTAALPFATLGNAVLQGYTTNAGDLGKATFTSNITTGNNFTQAGNVNATFIDLIFANTGASNANHLFAQSGTSDVVLLRCVFHGARGVGFLAANAAGGNAYLFECEAYDCNKSNTANEAGFQVANVGGVMFCYNCYSHDNSSGVNAHGFQASTVSGMILVNCIAETNGGSGAITTSTAQGLVCINSNFYNNTGDGVKVSYSAAKSWAMLINNNFLLNTGKGVNNTVTSQGGILYNNGRGAGTQANGAVDVLGSIANTSTDITYASNVTPWSAPTTGNFTTLRTSTAFGAGRGVFTETDGTNTGTVSYPDIGASEALVTGSGGLRLAGIGGLAS